MVSMSTSSSLILWLTLFATVYCNPFENIPKAWEKFKLKYNKNYSTDYEEKIRFESFSYNLAQLSEWKTRYESLNYTTRFGINPFIDMNNEEFGKNMFGYESPKDWTYSTEEFYAFMNEALKLMKLMGKKLPDEVDWRKEGAVTPVENQLHCRSSWAFSTTGALEGRNFKKTGILESLSEQELIDCYGGSGCCEGSMEEAYIIYKNFGLKTENAYPYEAKMDDCRIEANHTEGSFVRKSRTVEFGDEEALKFAVAVIGPMSVAIDASAESFQLYKSGVHHGSDCSKEKLNHAVLVVGYGTENGRDYWIVKNSWGQEWGDKGYIKMARNADNDCGIASRVVLPPFSV